MKNTHGGIIQIDHKFLLDILKLEGGKIHAIHDSCELFYRIAILVEHPDLPEVKEGESTPIVNMVFNSTVPYSNYITRVNPKLGFFGRIRHILMYSKWILFKYS